MATELPGMSPPLASHDPLLRRLADEGLYVGLAAWTQRSLAEALYPPSVTTAEDRLRYYAAHFPIGEVDSTFYAPPAESTAALWVERTPPGFLFDVKAFRLLTQHPTPPSSLWRSVHDDLPPDVTAKARIYARDLPPELLEESLQRFTAALEPLRAAGRLGLVLFQLPPYVYPSEASFAYLEWVSHQLGEIRAAVEFRQQRWMDERHRDRTLDFLARHNLALMCVDEPHGSAGSVPPVAAATADVAGVRFHGRNAELWEARDISPGERHLYDYSVEELREWVPKVRHLHEGGRPVHLLLNNCAGGHCVENARQLARLLADA